MSDNQTKLLVIGAGAGGVPAAIRARQMGASTTVVEAEHVGGVCMNRGCIPTKTLMETARLYRAIQGADRFGLKVGPPQVDWDSLMTKKEQTVNYLRLGTESVLKSNGVEIVRGPARFTGPHTVRVGDRQLEAENIVIATGSGWSPPPLPGIDLPGVITPDDVLNMRDIPAKVAILGSGPVELEMAQYLLFLGATVTVIEADKRILPEEPYRELGGRLAKIFKDQGLDLVTKAQIDRIEAAAQGLAVFYETKDGPRSLTVDRVLHAARAPRLNDLSLDQAGLDLKFHGLEVDEYLRTSQAHLYAIGDAVGGPFFSHRAAAMGVAAVENALGTAKPFDHEALVRGFNTTPEGAAVGLSESQAKKAGFEAISGTIPYAVNAMGMIRLDTQGMVKVVAEARYGQVLGVHIVGPQATELISEGALAVAMEATLDELMAGLRYHPSFSESQVDAARETLGRGLYVLR